MPEFADEARGLARRGLDEEGVDLRLDTMQASMLEALHGNPEAAEPVIGLDWLVRDAASLMAAFLQPPGPQTRVAAARSLIKLRLFLRDRERSAPREPAGDPHGVLLYRDEFHGLRPWTPDRPRRLEDIAQFGPKYDEVWREVAEAAVGESAPSVGRSRRPVSGSQSDRRRAAAGQSQGSARAQGSVVSALDDDAAGLLFELVKLPGMSFKTAEGRALIFAKVIRRIAHRVSEEDAIHIAHELGTARRVAPPQGSSLDTFANEFEAMRAYVRFMLEVRSGFLWDLRRHVYIPDEILFGRGKPQRDIDAPGAPWREDLPDATTEERLLFALAQVDFARRHLKGPFVPGHIYSGGLMFISHGPGDEQQWLTPDGRLYRVSQRDLNLEAFREAVVSAKGTIVLGYILIAAATVFLAAPLAVEALPEAWASLYNLVLTNPIGAAELAGFTISTVVYLYDVGLEGFLSGTATPEGAIAFLYELLTLRAALSSGRRTPADGVDPSSDSTPKAPRIDLSAHPSPAPPGALSAPLSAAPGRRPGGPPPGARPLGSPPTGAPPPGSGDTRPAGVTRPGWLESTAHPPAGAVKPRRPRGFDAGRAAPAPDRRRKPGPEAARRREQRRRRELREQGIDPTARPTTGRPHSSQRSVTRPEQESGIEPARLRAPRASARAFLRAALGKVSEPAHPLHFLVVPDGKGGYRWRTTVRVTSTGKVQVGRYPGAETGPVVQGGHQAAYAAGAPQQFMLEDADINIVGGETIESKGAYGFKPAVLIGDVPVEVASALHWERDRKLHPGTVERAPRIEPPDP